MTLLDQCRIYHDVGFFEHPVGVIFVIFAIVALAPVPGMACTVVYGGGATVGWVPGVWGVARWCVP